MSPPGRNGELAGARIKAAPGRAAELRARAAATVDAVAHQHRALQRAFDESCDGLGRSEIALLHEMVYGTLRWYGRLCAIVQPYLHKPLRRRDRDLWALILIGAYQLLFMRTPAYAAVAETVEGATQLGKPWAKGVINHVLRSLLRQHAEGDLPQLDAAQDTAFPEWLLAMIQEAYPQHWRGIADGSNQRPPFVLRVDTARVSRQEYLATLRERGIEGHASAQVESAVVLAQRIAVTRIPGFADGLVSVQDESAQLVARAMDLRPGLRILDACAAPGGKTAHLLQAQPRLAELVAVDVSSRTPLIQETLARLGVAAHVVAADVGETGQWWDGRFFDRILVDAPCSGTGVLRRHPDIKHLRRADDIPCFARRQQRLLDGLWKTLAPGGELVYVTCSILPAENESVVARFLRGHADARERPLGGEFGLTREPGRVRLPGLHGTDGFYYARIRKDPGAATDRSGDISEHRSRPETV